MLETVVWALSTGFVTGAVWFGIHFYRRGKPDIEALRRAEESRAQRTARRSPDALRAPPPDLDAGSRRVGAPEHRQRERTHASDTPRP